MSILDERFDTLENKIKTKKFREKRGLGNEVSYYIFDYAAEDEFFIRERIDYIKKHNENSGDEYKIVVFDLYDIMIEILENKNYLEKCYALETKKGFQKICTAVANLLRVNSTDGMLVNYIQERIPNKAIIFITGIGKCYPIIRSHTVLNNLHLVIDKVPVVMFYPGEFNGQTLMLFGKIKDDNYYRAIKIV